MSPRLQYDVLPASGAWPGGARYGYSRKRVFIHRPWSAAQVTLAESLGIQLPFVDYQYREVWWDAPLDNWVEPPDTDTELTAVYMTAGYEHPIHSVLPRLKLRHATKYAYAHWEKPDPLANIIKTVQRFITTEEGNVP